MKVEKNSVVSIEYTLTDSEGNVLDTSVGHEPLQYVQGVGAIIPGLEREMKDKVVGDKFKTVIAPVDGYGERNDSMIQELPRTQFGEQEVAIGQQFQVMTGQGAHNLTVMEIKDDVVIVDGNHPMAGITLNFDIEVKEVRAATEEELKPFASDDGGGCGSDSGGCGGCGGGCHS